MFSPGSERFSPGSALLGSDSDVIYDQDFQTPSPLRPPPVPQLVAGLPPVDEALSALLVALFSRSWCIICRFIIKVTELGT